MSVRRSTRISSRTAVEAVKKSAEQSDLLNNATLQNGSKESTTSSRKRKSRISTITTTSSSAVVVAVAEASSNLQPNDTISAPPDFVVPQTPIPKRRKPAAASASDGPPPLTPTLSAVKLITSSTRGEKENSVKPRPTEPRATNAPLSTPGGSRVVAYESSPIKPPIGSQGEKNDNDTDASPRKKRKAKETVAPDVGAVLPPTSTTETLLKDAIEHLVKVDPRLKTLIDKHHCEVFSPEGLSEVVDPFTALVSGIIGQQVSGQAAASIRKKFTALFPSHLEFPTPAQVAALDIATLRSAGLSQRKAEYIHGLAEKFTSGELSARMLVSASDEELIEKLVAVRGLGRWSVEMFACFGLKRMDVFSTGDLGIQKGMAVYMGKDVSKLRNKGGKWKYMTEKEMLEIAAKFSPYRSLFMWYMWRIVDVDISVMQS